MKNPNRYFPLLRLIHLFVLLIASGYFSNLNAGEYHVDKSRENLVKFISDAPIEDFEGLTDQIDGFLYWEGDNITHNSSLYRLGGIVGLRRWRHDENWIRVCFYR